MCINQYLLDNCCFVLFWFFFSPKGTVSLFFMKDELCSVNAMGAGTNELWEILPSPPAPGWDLEHTTLWLLPSPDLYSALVVPSSPSSPRGLGKDRRGSGWFLWCSVQWKHHDQHELGMELAMLGLRVLPCYFHATIFCSCLLRSDKGLENSCSGLMSGQWFHLLGFLVHFFPSCNGQICL